MKIGGHAVAMGLDVDLHAGLVGEPTPSFEQRHALLYTAQTDVRLKIDVMDPKLYGVLQNRLEIINRLREALAFSLHPPGTPPTWRSPAHPPVRAGPHHPSSIRALSDHRRRGTAGLASSRAGIASMTANVPCLDLDADESSRVLRLTGSRNNGIRLALTTIPP
ncbi:hypothetical protein BQ8794_240264 [Mesorhizobium prunaredense]|uniref:Uncharacterized protein n=1 Tax=Mesorhizobium prunaredense TaxID=1631249 RepID=A0A1R3V827_9HYPH|nr:hypothetical protein BQ8794_240264 [Mesorhizobium prunaredense]